MAPIHTLTTRIGAQPRRWCSRRSVLVGQRMMCAGRPGFRLKLPGERRSERALRIRWRDLVARLPLRNLDFCLLERVLQGHARGEVLVEQGIAEVGPIALI